MNHRSLRIMLLLQANRGFDRGLLSGIARYAAVNGPWTFYRKLPSYLDQGEAFTLEEFKAWKPDGIICSVADIDQFSQLDLPMVAFDPVNYSGQIPCIQVDDWEVGRLAARHLMDLGHRNFAFCGYGNLQWSDERRQAFCEALEEEEFEVNVYPSPPKPLRWSEEEALVSQWITSLPRPVGLFCVNDDRVPPVMELCRVHKLSVPEDISIIGADNDEMICDLENPPLTSVRLASDKAGYEASRLLHDLILGNEKMNGQHLVAPAAGIAVRQSTDVLMVKNPEIRKALQFIREHVNENIRVTDVVGATTLSHRYLNEQFQKELGSSVGKYLARERIEYICRLLTETDMRIQEIAITVGYEDDRHFARYFKRLMGKTPQAYRREISPP